LRDPVREYALAAPGAIAPKRRPLEIVAKVAVFCQKTASGARF
jgi:hypothetical protein